tara:strand:+ start:67 stop:360 length:294 start_codon:yes stop_codon:yes gene_type:complete
MPVTAKNHRTVVDEIAKLNKLEIEFLFEVIKNAMIPGKHVQVAFEILTKLKNQYQLYGKTNLVRKKTTTQENVIKNKVEEVQRELKEQDGELWVKTE